MAERDPDVEYHDGEEQAVCVGQWCCGCSEHPAGKPWGWNHEAWDRHHIDVHGSPALTALNHPESLADGHGKGQRG